MPIPIPVILGIGSFAVGAGVGIKKGFDAKDKNKKAEKIVKNAKDKFKKIAKKLKNEKEILNQNLEDFEKFKLLVFTTQIKNLVEVLKKCKDKVSSNLNHESINFISEEMQELQNTVSNSLEITSRISKGLQGGALTAIGAYRSVRILTASTSATMLTLGGVATGALIAIAGFEMDSKAEKNLTEACKYEYESEINVKKMKLSIEEFKAIHSKINELENIISGLTSRFDDVLDNIENISFIEKIKRLLGLSKFCKRKKIDRLIALGKALKMALDIPLLDKDGNENKDFKQEIKRITIS